MPPTGDAVRVLARYGNGNYAVTLYSDGTKVRETTGDAFVPAFPESIDVKITDRCDAGCPWCSEGSGPAGAHGSLDAPFLGTLVPGTELAIGGGDAMEHPGLEGFLERMASRGIVCSLTVSQESFRRHRGRLRCWCRDGLVHGLGVSLADPHPGLAAAAADFPNLVVHTIAGITDLPGFAAACRDTGWRPAVLVLGYKDRGRGVPYRDAAVDARIAATADGLHALLDGPFRVLSFDTLALRQLGVRRLFTTGAWREFHMGDDAEFTFFADLVRGEYAPGSASPTGERRPLLATASAMLGDVRRRDGRPALDGPAGAC